MPQVAPSPWLYLQTVQSVLTISIDRVSICLAGREHGDATDDAHAGSMHGSQLNMQTTLDLVLLLLDDIDAGQAISSERTQQLRAILLNDDGAPLCLLSPKAGHQTIHYITAGSICFLKRLEV